MPEFSRQHTQAAGGYTLLHPPYLIFPTFLGGSNTPLLLSRGLFPIDRRQFCHDSVKREPFGFEKINHIPLLDFAHCDRTSQTGRIE
jgi:hypothetical protein